MSFTRFNCTYICQNRKSSWSLTKPHLASVASYLVTDVSLEVGGSGDVGQVIDIICCDRTLHELFRKRHLRAKGIRA